MLKRKIEEKLQFWFEHRNQAMLISGARQIGKTFAIKHFIESHFESAVEIDFAKRPDLIDSFALLENSEALPLRLSLIAGEKMIPNKTIVFLDEIQRVYERREELRKSGRLPIDSQDIITAMKEMVQEGEYRFIMSGSLLGVTVRDINLVPVGYLDQHKMYPLDFEEFLWAKGVGEAAISHAKECFEKKAPVDPEINKLLLRYFREYVLVGGMPEAVQAFVEKKNLYLVNEAQTQILRQYRNDITTYIHDDGLKLRVRDIFDAIPGQLSSKNARFISSQVLDKQYLKHNKVEDEYLWLSSAGVAIPAYHVQEPVIPLSLSVERKTLKLFSNDVGLLISQIADKDVREKLLNGDKEINYGSPYENAAAQELISHGFDEELFYYNSKRNGEVDFLVTYKGEVLPIEIKSGKPKESQIYDRSTLNNLMRLYHHPIALVFGETNVIREKENTYQLPIYMIDFVRKG